MKKAWLGFLVLLLTICLSMTALASDTEKDKDKDKDDSEKTEEELEEEKLEKERQEMYDRPVQSNEIPGWPKGPGTYGEAGIVMEVDTGAILYAKNIDKKEYPASITKILTALVALENGDLSDKVTFTEDCVSFLEPGDSSIGMAEGDEITLEQALYATLLASANEAAYAVGENVGKNAGYDYDWFIEQMNEKCKELGCVNSNFVNTNGLHDDDHYTCARDMALIARELYNYPEFFDIVQTLQYTIPDGDNVKEEHIFQQKDKMLQPENSNYDKRVIGGKTGFTTDAQATLVTMADKKGTQLVCVVLRTFSGYTYSDTTALLDYGYDNFTKVKAADYEQPSDVERVYEEEDSGYVMLPKGVDFEDLDVEIEWFEENGREATFIYSYEGNYLGEANGLVTEAYVQQHTTKPEEPEIEISEDTVQEEEQPILTRTQFYLIIGGAVFLVVLIVILCVSIHIHRKRKQKRERFRENL